MAATPALRCLSSDCLYSTLEENVTGKFSNQKINK